MHDPPTVSDRVPSRLCVCFSDNFTPVLFPVFGYCFIDISHYLFGWLRVGDAGASFKNIVNAIILGRFHKFADVAREFYSAFDGGLTEELLEWSTDCEAGSIRLQSFEAKCYNLRRIWFGRRVSNEDIAKVKNAERHQGHLVAAGIQPFRLFNELETSPRICEDSPFQVITRCAGKAIHMEERQEK